MHIGIVGGGWMGLYLGHQLAGSAKVTIYESAKQVGGLSTYHDYGEFFWDKFYHVVLPTDKALLQAFKNIGVGEIVQWRETRTGYFVNNQIYELSNSLDFLRFPPLSLWQKFRLGVTILLGSRISDWRALEKVTVEAWLVKIGGRQAFEKFWKPLLLAKLGDNYHRVSAVFIWSYIKRLFGARDSSAKKEHMGFVEGGYKAVFDNLVETLERSGAKVLTECPVKNINKAKSGKIQVVTDEGPEEFDKVIFTGPTSLLPHLVDPALCRSYTNGSVDYLGVICVVLVTKSEVSPHYVLNIADGEVPFTGVIGMTSVVDRQHTNGRHLVYLPKYLLSGHEMFSWDDERIIDHMMPGLYKIFPDFDREDVLSIHVNRASKVQPLQVLHYSELVPMVETEHPDFFVLNTSQFTSDTLNNNSVARLVHTFLEEYFPTEEKK